MTTHSTKKPNSYLTKRGYVIRKASLTFRELHKAKKELTVMPFVNSEYSANIQPFPVYLESVTKVYLPRHYALQTFGEPDENRLHSGRDIDLEFAGSLRSKQQPVVDAFLNSCKPGGTLTAQSYGGIISVPCGFGKTVLALYLLATIGKKTIIIVHKEFLIDQWKERILQFLPFARIGIIRQKKVDVVNKDIVIAMLQSLSMKHYETSVFREFGFCIVDECHHLGAQVFSRALPKIGCHIMCGLSATPKRKDGLSKVFEWYLGPIVYQIKKRDDKQSVYVDLVSINSTHKGYTREEKNFMGKLCMPRMINNICNYNTRTHFLCRMLVELLKEQRNILVLSDRRGHLDTFYELLTTQLNVTSVGFYVGGMKPSQRKESESKSVILGTFTMAAEGMDIPSLNTIMLASPKSDIRQSIGRILRKKHEHCCPLIIDIIDQFSCFSRQAKKRQTIYRRNKYQMTSISIFDDGSDIDTMIQSFILDHPSTTSSCNKKVIE